MHLICHSIYNIVINKINLIQGKNITNYSNYPLNKTLFVKTPGAYTVCVNLHLFISVFN